ncbi:alpha-amylase family glycosyl hydrolase [Nocardioides gansuensis]|nr:alpha-amylase family glycosyl hydrolase [Nocardioides gansuensis]
MEAGETTRWWQDAVVYQAAIAQFAHEEGRDGDLMGLLDRLDHVADLGATCLWLLPFYESPFEDGGYDVTDHQAVASRYGTLADLDKVVLRAHELGLRVVVELVVQHTSIRHPWFESARRHPDSPYRDWFIWTDDPEHDPATEEPIFPTVERSVWSLDAVSGRFYRHLFYRHEPDLDPTAPGVVDEIERIVRFWLDRGVDGFRIDAASHLVDRAAQREGTDDGFWVLRRISRLLEDAAPGTVLMGEADVRPDGYADYFAAGLDLLTDFWSNSHLWLALARQQAAPLAEALARQPDPPPSAAYARFLRNHDELDLERLSEEERAEVVAAFAPEPRMQAYGRGIRRRLAAMLDTGSPGEGDRRVALAHAVLMSLPGAAVMLYGDEVGQDEDLQRPGRSAVRTPMAWDRVRDDNPLLEEVRRVVAARCELPRLATARVEVADVGHPAVLAICRGEVLMLANLSGRPVDVTMPPGDWRPVLVGGDGTDQEAAGRLRIGPHGYWWGTAHGGVT